MRVTIHKTIDLEQMPTEIDSAFTALIEKVEELKKCVQSASTEAKDRRYIDASESAENARLALTLLDKNLEEVQSLCLSYEKIRIADQMPPQAEVPDDG